jgi:hypothetical protein
VRGGGQVQGEGEEWMVLCRSAYEARTTEVPGNGTVIDGQAQAGQPTKTLSLEELAGLQGMGDGDHGLRDSHPCFSMLC